MHYPTSLNEFLIGLGQLEPVFHTSSSEAGLIEELIFKVVWQQSPWTVDRICTWFPGQVEEMTFLNPYNTKGGTQTTEIPPVFFWNEELIVETAFGRCAYMKLNEECENFKD